jgi:hypothetical protein
MQGPPPAEQAEQMFKERFSQMAYSVLFSKFPDLAQSVVTFKILEADGEAGNGMGAFVVLHNELPIYIPVVIVDGQLKPIEMFYYKQLNIFLPLDNTWLEEITKMSLDEMGQPENAPQTVPRDVSVRNLVLPPYTTGRYGYASVEEVPPEVVDNGINSMLKAAQDHTLDIHPAFLDVLRGGNKVLLDGVKLAFEQHPPLLQKIAKVYGVKSLKSAIISGYTKAKEMEKTAEAPSRVRVVTKSASPSDLLEIFGDRAKEAFATIMKHGYDVADNRDGNKLNRAIKIEGERFLQEPDANGGWYRLYFVDSNPDAYYVVPWPMSRYGGGRIPAYHGPQKHRVPNKFLAISKDMKVAFVCEGLMGEPISMEDELKGSALYKLLEAGKGSKRPAAKSYGFFLVPDTKNPQATEPVRIEYAIKEGGKEKYVEEYGGSKYIIDDDPSRKHIESAASGNIIFLPKNTTWVNLKSGTTDKDSPTNYDSESQHRLKRNSVIKDPRLVTRWLDGKMQEGGAKVASVRSDGSNFWRIEDDDHSYPFVEALEKVATRYHIPATEAAGMLKVAQEHGRANIRIVKGGDAIGNFLSGLYKEAQPPMPMEAQQTGEGPMMPPGGGMTPPGGGGDPSQMDPSMMGQPQAPPQPSLSPTDLAITEAVQQLQQQQQMSAQQMESQAEQAQQAMQQQAEQTEQLVGLLQGIQQRSAEIGQAAGGMIPPEAAGAPAAAAEMLAPQPFEEEPPPTPMMDVGENMNPEMVAQQINPQMVDQAEGLQDQGVFDTAAISMLASAPVLQDVVSTYVPNMEKCLDNIGRVLLTLWMTEGDTKEAIGDEAFVMLEDKLRTVFKSLGDVIITLSQNAVSNVPDEQAQQGQALGV